MELGFVMDRGDYTIPDVASWVDGATERSYWTGLKTKGKDVLPIKGTAASVAVMSSFTLSPLILPGRRQRRC